MSQILKFKIEEVVEISRTRIVDIKVTDEEFKVLSEKDKLDWDNTKDNYHIHVLTELVRQQHSEEGDMTELVIKAIRL